MPCLKEDCYVFCIPFYGCLRLNYGYYCPNFIGKPCPKAFMVSICWIFASDPKLRGLLAQFQYFSDIVPMIILFFANEFIKLPFKVKIFTTLIA